MKQAFLWAGLFAAGLMVGIALTLWSAAREPKRTADSPSGPATLITLSAIIDGSDRFVFTPDNVWHVHGQWSPPRAVIFNGEPWPDLSQPPAGWPDMVRRLDLAGASIAARKGRDVIALERTPEGFELIFADSQTGSAPYEVTLSIPRK